MRFVMAVVLSCLLVACADMPRGPGLGCTTAYQCEIQGYARAGN